MEKTTKKLGYLEWIALSTLYQHRDRVSSPLSYVGLRAPVNALINHEPPLATWVGKNTENQVHITPDGITLYEQDRQ